MNGVAGVTEVALKLKKPSYRITGKVMDENSRPVQGAAVYAYRTTGPGHADTMTGSDGSYTLYVDNGTWKVGTYLPGYGDLPEKTVTISDKDSSNNNFSPLAQGTTFYTVSGRVFASSDATYDSGEEISGAFVHIENSSWANDAVSQADGMFYLKVPAGNNYIIKAFAPGYGELPKVASFNVSSDTSGKDIRITPPNTVTVNIKDGNGNLINISDAFIDFFSTSTNTGNHLDIKNSSTGKVKLPVGSYQVFAQVHGMNINNSSIQSDNGASTVVTNGILTVDGDEIIKIVLPTFKTISGKIYHTSISNDNLVPNAWVEFVNETEGVHFGTMANASGTYSIKIAEGNYKILSMKPGYIGEPKNLVVSSTITLDGTEVASSSVDLVINKASRTISGQVLIGGSGASYAFVRAEKLGGGFSGTQADIDGNYTLYLSPGIWRVYAVSEGYAEEAYSNNPVDITDSSASNINIALSSAISLKEPKTKPIPPNQGGSFEDSNLGTKIVVPPNALGSSNSNAQVQVKETNNIRKQTNTAKVVGNKAKEIKVYDADGNPITNLNDSVTLEFSNSVSELGSNDTKTEVDKLNISYFDETTNEWVSLPTNVIYKDSSGDIVENPNEDLSDVSSVTFKATTDHFSDYALTEPTDPSAPDTPSGLSAEVLGSDSIQLTWTANTEDDLAGYYIYRDTSSNGLFPQIAKVLAPTTNYTDTAGLSSNTTYYYKISAYDTDSFESAASSYVSATTKGGGAVIVSGGGGGTGVSEVTPHYEVSPGTKPVMTKAQLIASIQTQLTALIAQLNSLVAELKAKGVEVKLPPGLVVSAVARFNTDLKFGMKSEKVKELQELLAKDKEIYPEGLVTGYFGPLTKAAVIRFQEKYKNEILTPLGLKRGTGYVGKMTRMKLNELFGK